MASGRVSDAERAAIIETLRETENVSVTAQRYGRGKSTVSRIASAEGIATTARTQTRAATEAKQADNRAKREKLKGELLDDARWLRRQLRKPVVEKKPMVVKEPGENSGSTIEIAEVHLDEPTFADKQRIMVSIGIAVDKNLALEKIDSPTETEGRSILERMLDVSRN